MVVKFLSALEAIRPFSPDGRSVPEGEQWLNCRLNVLEVEED